MKKQSIVSNKRHLDIISEDEAEVLSGGADNRSGTLDKRLQLFEQLHPSIREKLAGNVWEITYYNPLRFTISHTDHNQIINATVRKIEKHIYDKNGNDTGKTETTYSLELEDVSIGAIPLEIISNENPLGFIEHKYTIKFFSHTGKTFTVGPNTLDEIVTVLREKALVFTSRGATETLSTIVGAFAKENRIIINEDIETPGFYVVNNKLRAYHVHHPKPSKKKIQECCDLLDVLVTKYRCRELMPTAIKWAVIGPFNYALKQYTNDSHFLPWLHPYGWTRTGKTTVGGAIVNGIWGNSSDRKHKIPFSSADSEVKLGYVLNQSTYPITINEVSALGDDKHKKMLEMVKNSIETRIARSKHLHKTTYADIPALCPCVLTSNAQPPKDPGYVSKVIPFAFTKQDKPTDEEKKEFDNLMSQKGHLLRIVGDFAANYIMKNPQVLLKAKIEECDWKESAKHVIIEFYRAAGKPMPYWIDYFIEEKQLEESIDDVRLSVRSFFINLLNETYNKYARNLDDGQNGYTLFNRFQFCCDRGLIPSISLIENGKVVVVFGSIMKELHNPRFGIDVSEIASLSELANTVGLNYGQKWLNGKNTRVAYGGIERLISFLDCEIKSEEP